jgi:hypothetical protein
MVIPFQQSVQQTERDRWRWTQNRDAAGRNARSNPRWRHPAMSVLWPLSEEKRT